MTIRVVNTILFATTETILDNALTDVFSISIRTMFEWCGVMIARNGNMTKTSADGVLSGEGEHLATISVPTEKGKTMREKLIDVFMHLDEHISYKEEYGVLFDTPFAEAVEDVLKMLKNGVTVQERISVKDRLPDYGQEVIVYGGNYLKGCVTTMRFWDSNYVDWFGVTHWMPLPQPPKGE